ncbi:MAG: BatD family protein [Ginsengibacter sp.]
MITILRTKSAIIFFSILFISIVFYAQTTIAQVKFSVECPNKKIGKDDLLQIKFKVENAESVDNINPPDFKNFTVVSGPNQESSTSNINGKVSQYVVLGYSLQPDATGTFTIGPATAEADGQKLTTNPITITVVKGSVVKSQPNSSQQGFPSLPNLNFDFPPAPVTHQFDDYILKPGENVEDKTAKNLFIKLTVYKKSCYVGEPVVASYQLFTRLPSETTITDDPSFNGFSVKDLDVNSNSSLETYNGRKYNVYNIRKVQLYPLQSGDITLGSMKATNKVTFVKSQYANQQNGFFDIFQNFGQDAVPPEGLVERNVKLASKPVVINVKPLPEKNKPADFRGAVGDFSISASLEKNKITTDDAGNLKLTISGAGNIQLINAPWIHWPNGIDGYDAKVKDDVDRKKVPMQGSKTFSYPFTVSKAGNYTIDSIAFSYFDPLTATYKTLHTSPLQIEVAKGKGVPNNSLAAGSNVNNADEFIVTKPELIGGVVLVALIILAILFVMFKKNKNKDDLERAVKVDDLENEAETEAEKKEEKEFVIPQNPLASAHEKLMAGDSRGFYHTLDASLKKYLAAKFNVPANELSKKRLNEELDKCNVSLGTSLMLTSLLDEVELNLYAPPSTAITLNAVFEKASEVVSLLDKQVC